MPIDLCKKCGISLVINAYGNTKKIKGKNICVDCYTNSIKPYKLILYDNYGNVCGGTNIYKVIPKSNNKKIRLHNIVHHEYHLPGIRDSKDFSPVKNWNKIWNEMDGWFDPTWKNKFRGKLSRGIYEYNGNGMIAIIEDKKKGIFLVNGVWG